MPKVFRGIKTRSCKENLSVTPSPPSLPAFFQGRNRHVYAVASGIIQLPHGNAISEGVTVFPVGHHWVCLALLCAGTPISELPSHMHADLDKEQARGTGGRRGRHWEEGGNKNKCCFCGSANLICLQVVGVCFEPVRKERGVTVIDGYFCKRESDVSEGGCD